MDTCRPCGCKGRRSCLICETEYGIENQNLQISDVKSYIYCYHCNKAWPGWEMDLYKSHPHHDGVPIDFPGIYIEENFLSTEEEQYLMDGIDNMQWDQSQSGRRKQNFGPKCNFKKRRVKCGNFAGFPEFTLFVQEKFKDVSLLSNFQTIEQCSLEYDRERGASIDPHIDDCWIWGERIVTVNLLSDSVLTMSINSKHDRYNLGCVKDYPAVLNCDGSFNYTNKPYSFRHDLDTVIVRIPMPRRSLIVMYGLARYEWEHSILREDIRNRRICLAYREFTPTYLPYGDKYDVGKDVLNIVNKQLLNKICTK